LLPFLRGCPGPGTSGGGLHRRGGGRSRAGLAARPASPRGPGLRRRVGFSGGDRSKSKSKSDPPWTSKSKSKPKVRSELDFEV
jgi:hypothetical protein